MSLYKLQTKLPGDPFQFIIKKGPSDRPDSIFKDGNLNNPDYVEYKEWVDAGNTPEAAD